MTLIDKVVKDLFGEEKVPTDINDPKFVELALKAAPDVLARYHEYTPERAINEFLFEYSELGKELKKIMDQLDKTKNGQVKD